LIDQHFFSFRLYFVKRSSPLIPFSYDIASPNSVGSSPAAIELELLQEPIDAEVINDQVALDIQTPNVIVSSQGKNDFGVAYDPTSKKAM
jgi:hypothetical protein